MLLIKLEIILENIEIVKEFMIRILYSIWFNKIF